MTQTVGAVFKFGAILVALIAVSIAGDRIFSRLRQPADPEAALLLAEVDRQGFKQLLADRLKTIKTADQARAFGFGLSRRGIARLSPAHLAERTNLLLYLDQQAADSICAARFMGTLPPSAFGAYLAQFDSVQHGRWITISASAMKAELLATETLPPLTGEEIQQLFSTLIAAATAPDHDRLQATLADAAHSPVSDQCWAAKTIARVTLDLPEPDRTTTLKAIARLDAGN